MTAPNGKKYKPLFAPLIMDLDNRLNLFLTGNLMGPGNTHVSNQGYGPTEINLSKLLSQAPVGAAAVPPPSTDLLWAYGQRSLVPSGIGAQWPLRNGPVYARIDLNGLNGFNGAVPPDWGCADAPKPVQPQLRREPAVPHLPRLRPGGAVQRRRRCGGSQPRRPPIRSA